MGVVGAVPTLPENTVAIQLVRVDELHNCFVYYEAVTFAENPRATCDMYLRRAAITGKIGAGVESDYTVMALGGPDDVLDEWPIERDPARYLIKKLKMRVERD